YMNWIEDQQHFNSNNIVRGIGKLKPLEDFEFTKRMEPLTLHFDQDPFTSRSSSSTNHLELRNIYKLIQCDECKQLVEENNVGACLLCSKQCHYSCMDVIVFLTIFTDTFARNRIVPVTLYSGNLCIHTFAYQDDGSDVTMIEESLITELRLTGILTALCLMWTADIHRKENSSKPIEVEISGQGEFIERFVLHDVRTVEWLGLPIQTVLKDKLVEYFPYMRDIPLIDYTNAVPRMLIGSDNANLNVPLEIVEGTFSQPIVCKSRIGWSIHGRTNERTTNSVSQNINIHRTKCPCQHTADEAIHQLVKNYFSLENLGVTYNKDLQFCSKEDERALDILTKHTKRIGNRFETALLWKYDNIILPDSYNMAYKRLLCLEKHRSETIAIIDKTINEYLQEGYASKLTKEDIRKSQNARLWYLLIFTVQNPKKPDIHIDSSVEN
ncbi:hypothetical protein Bhyg_09646, partial [Pseudolycoriella hygida]